MTDSLEPIVEALARTLLTISPEQTAEGAAQAVRALLTERQYLPLVERFDLRRFDIAFIARWGATPQERAAMLQIQLALLLAPAG